MASVTGHYRNPIFATVTGMATAEKYIVELKMTYEVIPTLTYKAWAYVDG